jgi:hypothetical protein
VFLDLLGISGRIERRGAAVATSDRPRQLGPESKLRVEVDGQAHAAGAGAVAFLPRQLPHAFVVTSPQVRYLTFHTPAGFDRFTLAVGTPATVTATAPPEAVPPDPAALAAMASSYGIEIVGPPPTL